MQKFLPRGLILFGSIAFLTLVGCTNQSNAKSSIQLAESNAAQSSNSASIDSAPKPTLAKQSAKPTGNLLSPAQVTKLTKLPIPIVAPAYLPQGFRVVRADGDSVKYANGDDDAGYTIEYQGEDGTCFAIYSSKDGPRRLKQVGEVESGVGTVKMYEATYEGRSSVQGFIPVRGNPVMISPVLQLNPATGSHEACKALDRPEYERILKSIELVK